MALQDAVMAARAGVPGNVLKPFNCHEAALGCAIIGKSLAGHIPRSLLRASDLTPFYHQYPAACCGDFLSRVCVIFGQ